MIDSTNRHALALVDLLWDDGPLTKAQACEKLEWPESRFTAALRFAREQVCPGLEVAIPMPTPPDWLYVITDDWDEVERGAAYALGLVDTRLNQVYREVETILPKLKKGTKEWRRANFLDKHLGHITRTMNEINSDPR